MVASALEAVAVAICAARGLTFAGAVGAGSFKEAFRATQPNGEDVALKVFTAGVSLERAQREIDAMLRCHHPGIAKLLFIDRMAIPGGGEHLYSVEEFLAGGTLARRVTARGLLSAEDARAIGSQLIGAIAHIAALDLVHRDVKPDNIMLRGDGRSVLIDFGIVRNLADSSLTNSWLPQGPGTPEFASPEQLLNEKLLIDWRADQFSLGVTLSIACFGRHPYAEAVGQPTSDVVARVGRRVGPTADFVAAAKRHGLETLVQMVAAWPFRRFRTPDMLKAAW